MRIAPGKVISGATVLLLVGGSGAAGTSRHRFSPVRPAAANAPTDDRLLVPDPLGEQVQGRSNAPVTIIEHSSMTCPHCANFDVNVYPIVKSKYIDIGKVRSIIREFPLDRLAVAGFLLARCAGDNKYFSSLTNCCVTRAIGSCKSRSARCAKLPSKWASRNRASTLVCKPETD